MATTSSILELILLALGESASGGYLNWGEVANANFSTLEKAVGEVESVAVTVADVSLTDAQHNALFIKASGALTGARAIETQDRKGFWFVTNACTGDFALTFKTDSGTGVIVPQGGAAILASDGTNIIAIALLRANGAGARVKHATKAAGNYTAAVSDDGGFHEITATTTIALKPAALLGDQWCLMVKANGAVATIDPDGAELINGASTLALADGTSALIVCTGTAFRAIVFGNVTLGGTETLANKTFTLPQINDTSADHQYVLAVAELTADRTVALPLLTANDEFVFKAHPQELTAKTLTDPAGRAFAGHIFGLALSNGTDATNDIDIAAGSAGSDDAVSALMALTSALTKRLDAGWAVGTNQGGLDTGAIANTTYHVWLIRRSDTGVVDALFSTSATAPTMPANYDQKRRIGSIVRLGGTILAFSQDGDEFLWSTVKADIYDDNPGTSAVTRTLTVPTGIKVRALLNVSLLVDATGSALYLSSLDQSDEVVVSPSVAAGPLTVNGSVASIALSSVATIRTNTSGQIRSRLMLSTAGDVVAISTNGWIDTRGRNA